jgi:long-subunit acyl-CoA synthetase (AMP-forming)
LLIKETTHNGWLFFNNINATNEVIIDGWLHTGDLAQQDEQVCKIVGRKKI